MILLSRRTFNLKQRRENEKRFKELFTKGRTQSRFGLPAAPRSQAKKLARFDCGDYE